MKNKFIYHLLTLARLIPTSLRLNNRDSCGCKPTTWRDPTTLDDMEVTYASTTPDNKISAELKWYYTKRTITQNIFSKCICHEKCINLSHDCICAFVFCFLYMFSLIPLDRQQNMGASTRHISSFLKVLQRKARLISIMYSHYWLLLLLTKIFSILACIFHIGRAIVAFACSKIFFCCFHL